MRYNIGEFVAAAEERGLRDAAIAYAKAFGSKYFTDTDLDALTPMTGRSDRGGYSFLDDEIGMSDEDATLSGKPMRYRYE